jgi:hypothetical protein
LPPLTLRGGRGGRLYYSASSVYNDRVFGLKVVSAQEF